MILNHLQFNNGNGHSPLSKSTNNLVFNTGFHGMAVGQPVLNIREHLKTDLPRVEFTSIEISDIYCRLSIEAQKSHNRDKNRYVNILPCDHSRVLLSEEEGSDYINANFINGEASGTEKSYIATQGPLQHTRKDFWRMMWENLCFVIVMLGKDKENNRIKVDRYWPEEGEAPFVFGSFTITLLSRDSSTCDGAIITRRLQLYNARTQTSRIVTHFQYEGWPDHGTPKQSYPTRHLVRMVEQIRGSSSQVRPPVVVHCSAGVGRTGAFITIHLTMEKIRRAQQNGGCASLDFNIYQTVQRLRQQRPGMVQQQEQYFFCYEAIAEEMEELGCGVYSDSESVTSDSNSNASDSDSSKTSDPMFLDDRGSPSDMDENSNGSDASTLRSSIESNFSDFNSQRPFARLFPVEESDGGSGYSSGYDSNNSSISSSAANSFCMEDEALI